MWRLALSTASLLFAAASVPLFTPPAGWTTQDVPQVMRDADASRRTDVLALYGDSTHKHLTTITVQRRRGVARNADEIGLAEAVSQLAPGGEHHTQSAAPAPAATPCAPGQTCKTVYRVHVSGGTLISSGAVTVCGDRPGWRNRVFMPAMDKVIAEVFVRSGDDIYSAMTEYGVHDPYGKTLDASLLTLCPPQVAQTPAPPLALPVKTPQGWVAATLPALQDPTERTLAYWMRLGATSNTLNNLFVLKFLTVPESMNGKALIDAFFNAYHMPDMHVVRDATVTLCGGLQGWAQTQSGKANDGSNYVVEMTDAYANGSWYLTSYSRRADDPEDPAARATLDSLCPQ